MHVSYRLVFLVQLLFGIPGICYTHPRASQLEKLEKTLFNKIQNYLHLWRVRHGDKLTCQNTLSSLYAYDEKNGFIFKNGTGKLIFYTHPRGCLQEEASISITMIKYHNSDFYYPRITEIFDKENGFKESAYNKSSYIQRQLLLLGWFMLKRPEVFSIQNGIVKALCATHSLDGMQDKKIHENKWGDYMGIKYIALKPIINEAVQEYNLDNDESAELEKLVQPNRRWYGV